MSDAIEWAKIEALRLLGISILFGPTDDKSWQEIARSLCAARREAMADKLPCGHPVACLVDDNALGNGKELNRETFGDLTHCAWCADLERAKEAVREACAKLMEGAYLWGHGPDTAPKALARQIRALDLSKVGGYH